MSLAHERKFLKQRRLANSTGAKDLKNKEGKGFRGQRGFKERKLAITPDKARMTRLS
jgi:hypothetical protein